MDISPERPDADDDDADGDGDAAAAVVETVSSLPSAAHGSGIRTFEEAVDALESSSDHDEPENDTEGDGPTDSRGKKRAPAARRPAKKSVDTFDSLVSETGTWRALGLFATEKERDKPYMLMESYFRGRSGTPEGLDAHDLDAHAVAAEKSRQRVAVVRVSATNMLAQLVLSPLYEFRVRLAPDPDRAGFFYIDQLNGPVAFAGAALGTHRSLSRQKRAEAPAQVNDPYFDVDADYRHVVEQLSSGNEVMARLLHIPLTARVLELIFARSLVAGPGKTLPWYWTPQSRPVDMHVVRQYHEDPLGMWITHGALWHDMSVERRRAYTEKWCGAHFGVFEGRQILDRWALARERYGVGRAFARFCSGLVLTHDRADGTDYTALSLNEEQQRRHKSHPHAAIVGDAALPFYLSHAVAALERAREAGTGKSILHVRPAVIHLLMHRNRAAYMDTNTELPLTMVETLRELPPFMALLSGASELRNQSAVLKDMFKLLQRVPRNWFQSNGGVAAVIGHQSSMADQRDFERALVRLEIDKRAVTNMDRTRSSAYYVRLHQGRLLNELRAWLYGNADDTRLTAEDLSHYLTSAPRSLYVRAPHATVPGTLVRVSDATTMRIEMTLAVRIHGIVSAARQTHEGLDMTLMPLDMRSGLGHGGLERLAQLLMRCALSNTIVVTPYNRTRRMHALASVFHELQGHTPRDILLSTMKPLLCSSDRFDLSQPAVQQRASTVIIDAAHLMTAAQLLEIVDAFAHQGGLARNMYFMGSASVLPHHEGAGTARGCAFHDLLRTFPDMMEPNGIEGSTMTPDAAALMMRRNDMEVLQTALTQWRTLEGARSILSIRESRPSQQALTDYKPGTRFYTLLAAAQRYTPYTSDPATLVRTYGMALHHTGAHDMDMATVYEMEWIAFTQLTITELIAVLSHGYRVIIYSTPAHPCPWKPTADVSLLAHYLTEHFRKRLYGAMAVPRVTTWQAIGLPKMQADKAAAATDLQ